MSPRRAMPGALNGLSFKLIATIALTILAVEAVIFVPSAANFGQSWLNDRLRVGLVAAQLLDSVPEGMSVPAVLTDRLLNSASAIAIVYRRAGQTQLISLATMPVPGKVVTVDMTRSNALTAIVGTLDTLVNGGGRILRVLGNSTDDGELAQVEVLVDDTLLREGLFGFFWNVLLLWLVLAGLTALLLYLPVSRLLIAPIRRLTENMVAYRGAPENAALIISPTSRNDEIGVVERELAAMETDIFSMLRQRRHLADLGLAVAKINHDLRNTLTSAQLLSDQVVALDDPQIQRLAPRLVQSIDKALGFAQSVLDYGRESPTPPKPVPVDLRALVDESAIDAGALRHPQIAFRNDVPDDISLNVDPEQLARALVNLIKNAREALEACEDKADGTISIWVTDDAEVLTISVCDNGPGLPPRARENLFVAFEGSAKAGGTGLGLAIARELISAHGGDLSYAPLDPGTRFDVVLPAAIRFR